MKLLSVVGARPQFVKIAPLHREISKRNHLHHFILHTGQHYDFNLSEVFFRELEIPKPSFHLEVNERSLASSTEIIQKKIEAILEIERPDIVIVLGDTNSTLAGALASKNFNIKLAHIEAGLRSFNNSMPEEKNRVATDRISDFLFCPTTEAVNNLMRERLNTNRRILLSGDVMLDAYNFFSKKIERTTSLIIPDEPFILCTLHRQGLVQSRDKLSEVVKALNEINGQIPIILPAHPRLRLVINEFGLRPHFKIIEPVGYLNMLALIKACNLVMTDSGGLQKEAFFSKKICITLRDETEWTELVQAHVNFIAGDSSSEKIIDTFKKSLDIQGSFDDKFYGEGNASEIIVKELIS